MALILVQTPGAPDANSYALVATADQYNTYRIGGAGWATLSPDEKIQALVTATRDIDSAAGVAPGFLGGFIGERASEIQALEWPRSDADPYSDTELPAVLSQATIELALSYVPQISGNGDVLNIDRTNANIKRKKVDVLETEYFEKVEDAALSSYRFPPEVQRLLASLILVANDMLWGTGTSQRSS